MKRMFLCLTAILLFFTACEKYSDAQCPCGKMEVSKKGYISMCIIPEVVTENSVNMLRMENYTKEDLMYDSDFYMEYFHENQWIAMEWNFFFTDIGYILCAGNAKEGAMNLHSLAEEYNDSKKGKYRILKEVGRYNLIAEFEIK